MPVVVLVAAATLLIWIVKVDFFQFRIPDIANVLLFALAVIFHVLVGFRLLSPLQIVVGAFLAGGSAYLLRETYWHLRRVDCLGLGDVKFLIAAGAWVGPLNLPGLILAASLSTLLVIYGANRVRGRSMELVGATEYPFGPGLVLGLVAAFVQLMWGRWNVIVP